MKITYAGSKTVFRGLKALLFLLPPHIPQSLQSIEITSHARSSTPPSPIELVPRFSTRNLWADGKAEARAPAYWWEKGVRDAERARARDAETHVHHGHPGYSSRDSAAADCTPACAIANDFQNLCPQTNVIDSRMCQQSLRIREITASNR